ncbi:hypothetical protein L7F22_068539 [Adiantum nelumboides]|nr:hypothetical protein [Adiantum nelumboides]
MDFDKAHEEYDDNDMDNNDMDEFINDWYAGDDIASEDESFLRAEALQQIYKGSKLSRLSASLLILNLQNRYAWSNASVLALSKLLSQKFLPPTIVFPKSRDEAKKMISKLGLDYDMIHACPNDCVLYRGKRQVKNLNVCLAPLIDDLLELWRGIDVLDMSKQDYGRKIRVRGILSWTIHDFSGYGYCAGCSTKGYKACSICGDWLKSTYTQIILIPVSHLTLLQNGLMQHVLPLVIDGCLTTSVHDVIYRLGKLARWITSKEIDISSIAQKKRECIELLCVMEKELPTSFFDIQVHILIHLVDEIETAGVVTTCWIFWVERFMGVLKGLVRQRAQPEGFMSEGWVLGECMYYLAEYLERIDEGAPCKWTLDEPTILSDKILCGKGICFKVSYEERTNLSTFVIYNSQCMENFVEVYHEVISSAQGRRS